MHYQLTAKHNIRNKQPCCRREATQCFESVSSQLQQYNMSSAIFYCQPSFRFRFTAAQIKVYPVLFCSAYSLMRDVLCRKQTCNIILIHYWTDDRQLLIALAPAIINRYWPTIAICAHPTCIHHPYQGNTRRNIAIMYGMENQNGVVWLPDSEKNVEDAITCLEFMKVTDRWKDTV